MFVPQSCFVKALRHYCQQNSGLYPQRIVVFRDGVGEGDIDYVKNVSWLKQWYHIALESISTL